MRKIIRTSTVPDSLYLLLKGQLNFLSNYYDVIGLSGNGEFLQGLKDRENIKIIPIDMQRSISPVKDLIALIKLIKCFKNEKPYIVHSITPKAGLLSMIAAYLTGVPIRVHTFTGLIFPSKTGLFKTILILMDKLLCKLATHIYPEGLGVKNDLLKYKITSKNLKVLANGNVNGIDPTYFNRDNYSDEDFFYFRENYGIKKDDFVFLYVGRIVKDKGITELIAAFLKISKEEYSTKLLLVGPFEDSDSIASSTLELINKHPQIIHVGFQKDVRPFYLISDTFVFPSYREGFPNVLLEAGAMGLPMIVTDINGSNEIVLHDINGIIIPIKNIDLLYSSMRNFMSDKALIEKYKMNSRQIIISKFDQSIVWNALLQEYRKIENDV